MPRRSIIKCKNIFKSSEKDRKQFYNLCWINIINDYEKKKLVDKK